MKKFLFTLVCAFVVLCACTPQKEKNMQKLESLAAEVKANAAQYTDEDWMKFLREYQVTDSLIALEEYTEEEFQRIGQLKGQCAGYLVKAKAIQVKQGIGNAIKEVSGAAKGFMDALSGKSEE